MKSVSKAYRASMEAPLRERSYIEIVFSNTDVNAARDGAWESNGAESYSEVATVDFPYDYGATIATLELNRWTLNGKDVILRNPNTLNDGFVSSKMSGADGTFTAQAVLTRNFSNAHSFAGITLTFDTRNNDYPTALTVAFWSGGEKVDEVSLTPTGTTVAAETAELNIDKVEVTFDAMLPYRRPRVERVLFGLEVRYLNDDIVSCKQSHDVDPLSRRLPQEKAEYTILDYEHKYDPDNATGAYRFVDVNSPVTIRHGYTLPDGSVEWLKADRYLLTAKPSVKNSQATFTATGLIESLNGIFYKGTTGQKNFYDMAVAVLQDANLTPTEQGDDPWDIDESLQQMLTTAVLPIDTHKNCLQLIAHACRCRLYTDDDNIIHIKPFGVTVNGIYEGDFTDNGHTWFSEWGTVDKGNDQNNTYATLELNRWRLDGERQLILPDEEDFEESDGRGFVSSVIGNQSGVVTPPARCYREFDVTHDLRVIGIRFDTILNDFPTWIRVDYYRNGNTIAYTTISDVASSEIYVRNDDAINCDKIRIAAKNVLPYHRIRIAKVFYRESDFALDFNTISQNSQSVNKIDKLKNVTVAKTYHTADGTASNLFEETTTETELHVEFNSIVTGLTVTVTGGSVVSRSVYGRAIDLVLSSGTKTVKITGTRVTESTTVRDYSVSDSGETDVEENPLITTDDMSDALAAHVQAYLQMRNTYDADYRGNPELEVGDIIGLQTAFTDEMNALVLVDELTFNGALRGKVKVKGLI